MVAGEVGQIASGTYDRRFGVASVHWTLGGGLCPILVSFGCYDDKLGFQKKIHAFLLNSKLSIRVYK